MKALILTGGIPYSGKSYFSAKIQESDPRFQHIDADKLHDIVGTKGNTFFKYFKLYDPGFYNFIIGRFAAYRITDSDEQVMAFGSSLRNEGFDNRLTRILTELTVAYAIDTIQNAVVDYPIFDGRWINKRERELTYNAIQEWRARFGKPSIDDWRKILVYFNLGLDVSLERFALGRSKPLKLLSPVKEEDLQTFHSQSEIPTAGELPNLEVLVVDEISENKPIEYWIQELQRIVA